MHELSEKILKQDIRALSRAISYMEDKHQDRLQILKDVYPHTNRALKIGITGAPGAGKSSFVNQLIKNVRKQNKTVGMVAIDPTSPFTGGAILGDRVRMSPHFTDQDVFIRSMGTRGSLGGLARATKEAVHLMDAFGKDVVLIETVGVGQSELDIMHVADTVAVMLAPGSGDVVQAFKAGIMEIADVYIINKADLSGTEKLETEINDMLNIVKHDAAWRPPVLKTVSTKNEGISEVWQALVEHHHFIEQSVLGNERKIRQRTDEMLEVLFQQFKCILEQKVKKPPYTQIWEQVQAQQVDPYTAAEEVLHKWLHQKKT